MSPRRAAAQLCSVERRGRNIDWCAFSLFHFAQPPPGWMESIQNTPANIQSKCENVSGEPLRDNHEGFGNLQTSSLSQPFRVGCIHHAGRIGVPPSLLLTSLGAPPSFYFCALDRYASGASRIQQGKSRSSGESIAQTFQLLDVKNRRLLIFFFFYYFFGLLSASFLSSRSLFIGWSRKTRLTRCYSFESNDYLFLFLLPC